MPIEIATLRIPDVKIIRTPKFGDERGFFSETYNVAGFRAAGITTDFVQDNHSWSARAGTIRGLHFQSPPFAQDKLVRVARGRILDVAVDLRKSSPTFGTSVTTEISAQEWNQIFVPKGFAHGFCTLEDNTEVIYKVSQFHSKPHDIGIFWNDPELGIDWPVNAGQAIVSAKDIALPRLRDITAPFA